MKNKSTEFSIPADIIGLANSQQHADFFALGDLAMCQRLVTGLDMIKVWSEVCKINDQLEAHDELNEGDLSEPFRYEFLTVATSLKARWTRLCKVPSKTMDKHVDLILSLAIKLQKTIDAHRDELCCLGNPRLPTLPRSKRDLFASVGIPEDLWLRPTKPNASSAETTFYARALSNFFYRRTGSQHLTLVALTISALLDLPDPITPDHVAKLCQGLT